MAEIRLKAEDGTEEIFYVVEQTVLAGMSYLLVADSEDEEEDAAALILKDVSGPEDPEAVYVEVTDDTELAAVIGIFSEMLGDVEIV